MIKLEEIIGYNFKDRNLLKNALTHPSAKKNKLDQDYERLEFLGDSIMGMLVSEKLYQYFYTENEGNLAKRRAALVCTETLAKIANDIGLGEFIILGIGENASGGRQNPSILEDALEALIAATYLDGGLEAARKITNKFFDSYIKNVSEAPKDPKSTLQEYAQSKGWKLPEYSLISMEGAAHEPKITVNLKLADKELQVTSNSRKNAERQAAEEMLKIFR